MARMSAVENGAMLALTRLHRTLNRASGGRLGARFKAMEVVELITTGRRSGQRRSSMLTVPVELDGNPVVVASRGGDDRPPAWLLNLQADPAVEVRRRGRTVPMRARVLDEAEREALWPQVVEAYAGYGGYQRKTDRVIPLVVLEPAG